MSNTQRNLIDNADTLETEIAGLLSDLANVQGELHDILTEKRNLIVAGEADALSAFAVREQQVVERLQACQQRRQCLLDEAAAVGRPADSIRDLAKSLPAEKRAQMQDQLEHARHHSRLLQHDCLTNWVLVQRTLLHLSQLVEIIATGGRMKPTYGDGAEHQDGGSLVDQAA